MPPKTSKPAMSDSVTLTGRDAAAIRAGFLTGGNWQYNSNEIGKLLGLGCTRNGGRVFQGAINKIGLEYSNGSFRDMTDDVDDAAPIGPTATKNQTISNVEGVTVKKREANDGDKGTKAGKKAKLEHDEGEGDAADDGDNKHTAEKADAAAGPTVIKTEKATDL